MIYIISDDKILLIGILTKTDMDTKTGVTPILKLTFSMVRQ